MFNSNIPVSPITVRAIPFVDRLLSRLMYRTTKDAINLNDDDKKYIKDNIKKYNKVQNWAFFPLMLIGFIFLFNYNHFNIQLPHIIFTGDYTGVKIAIVAVFSVVYWSYTLLRVSALFIFGKKGGSLMTDYAYLEGMDKFIQHRFSNLFGYKQIIVLIISALVLFI